MSTSTSPTKSPTASTPLGDVVTLYRAYVAGKLNQLTSQVDQLRSAAVTGNRPVAQQRWLTAQFTWQQVGASYGSFGAYGTAISGLASGLPKGTADPAFVGLHRIELGVFGEENMNRVLSYVNKLAADVAKLRANLDKLDIDPKGMPLRCHETLEDSLRDHLSGNDDYGSGMAYALTAGDLLATRELLTELKPLIPIGIPGHNLYDLSSAALDALQAVLNATKVQGAWPDFRRQTKHQRQPVNASIGATLEVLYQIPFALGRLS
ncbi:MAG: EfeM/EfeO family lipoprotein [Jatrophihabitantaceae bacterium]